MTDRTKPAVIIADDQEFMLTKVCELLGTEFNVVAKLQDGTNVAQKAMQLKPDALVLDISMPNVTGIQAADEVRRLGLPVRLVFLTVQEDEEYVRAAAAMNASYVLKRRMHLDLCLALREALTGKVFVSPSSVLHPVT